MSLSQRSPSPPHFFPSDKPTAPAPANHNSLTRWLSGNNNSLFRLGRRSGTARHSMTPTSPSTPQQPRGRWDKVLFTQHAGSPNCRTRQESAIAEATADEHEPTPRPRADHSHAAYLSMVAREFRRRVVLVDRVKNGIEYKNVFDGREAVDKLLSIVPAQYRQQRDLALRIGRALGAQRFFHDVSYESRLIDTDAEIYQFYDENDIFSSSSSDDASSVVVSAGTMTTASSNMSDLSSVTMLRDADAIAVAATRTDQDDDEDDDDNDENEPWTAAAGLPTGVFTELTPCYNSLCNTRPGPCYSAICPKRQRQPPRRRPESMDANLTRSTTHAYLREREQEQELWMSTVSKQLVDSLSPSERKRQEVIFELANTEEYFVRELEYVNKMWIKPLRRKDVISADRRETFIHKVFCNIMTIHEVNLRFLRALRARQKEASMVAQIGDVVLDFVANLEPFLLYGSRQHEAKYIVDIERATNPRFRVFAEETERHPSSRRLELDGYLTKPTTRLSRYTLILDAILKYTPADHPDLLNIPKATDTIKQFLTRVNEENGKAKNRFDLDRIDQKLLFKTDKVDLHLADEDRQFVKQVKLRKAPSPDSPEYHLLLFDHYLVISKIKYIKRHERYVVKRRPIPLELLDVSLQPISSPQRARSVMPSPATYHNPGVATRPSVDLNRTSIDTAAGAVDLLAPSRLGYPITLQHLGRRGSGSITLFASAYPVLKLWVDQIKLQQATKVKSRPIFELVPAVQQHRFFREVKVNHLVTFNAGQQYVMATDHGVFVGHTGESSKPRKVLNLDKIAQVQVLEEAQLLLVLANGTLWEYGLDVVNGKPEDQPEGCRIQTHVPHFHVGTSLDRKLVCVPRVSPLTSTITTFETSRPQELLKNKRFFGKLVRGPASGVHLRRFKDYYIPDEAWNVELSTTQLRITCPRGMVMVDMESSQPQQMLNHADKSLSFITEREKDESRMNIRPPVKHIAVFRTPRSDHLVCYDEYAFYIDSKGNRVYRNFRIEFEGAPETFAFSYPYIIAFDPDFIEVRHVITGELEQIIRGHQIRCINNGYKTETSNIYGVMTDPIKPSFQNIFQLKPLFDDALVSSLL